MAKGDIILRLVNLSKSFEDKSGKKVTALDEISSDFKRGELVAVVGESGSGKSTLINILGGLDYPTSGEYFCEGNDVSGITDSAWDALRSQKIGMIFQSYQLLDYLSVYENILLSLDMVDIDENEKKQLVLNVLEDVGLLSKKDFRPTELSGGQRQRVSIARALVKNPDIILADEPTAALDKETGIEIINLIKKLSEERVVIVITHDIDIVQSHATRIIELKNGKFATETVKVPINKSYNNIFEISQAKPNPMKSLLKLTIKKMSSSKVSTVLLSLLLAVAFSFTIIFNGVYVSLMDGEYDYYNALNSISTTNFYVGLNNDSSSSSEYTRLLDELESNLNKYYLNTNSKYINTYNSNLIKNDLDNLIYKVKSSNSDLELNEYFNINIMSDDVDYKFDDLKYKVSNKSGITVTSEFMQRYFGISERDIEEYMDSQIMLPIINYKKLYGIQDSNLIINNLFERESGEIISSNNVVQGEKLKTIRYAKFDIDPFCYVGKSLNEFSISICNDQANNSKQFDSLDEYYEYMINFEEAINSALSNSNLSYNENIFELLVRSDALYYLVDLRENEDFTPYNGIPYRERVYEEFFNVVNQESLIVESIYKDIDEYRAFEIKDVVYSSNPSLYLALNEYEDLLEEEEGLSLVKGYFSVALNEDLNESNSPELAVQNKILAPIAELSSFYTNNYNINSNNLWPNTTSCSTVIVDGYKNEMGIGSDAAIIGNDLVINEYSKCLYSSELGNIGVIYAVIANLLVFSAIVFFLILMKIRISNRISEIGVFRSIGFRKEEVKNLFFLEIVFMMILSTILAFIITYTLYFLANTVLLERFTGDFSVISVLGQSFVISGSIVRINIINLFVYSVIVLSVISFYSLKTINRVTRIKPVDIMRGDEDA